MVKEFFSKLRSTFSSKKPEYDEEEIEDQQEYLELSPGEEGKQKIVIRPFVLEEFGNVKPMLDALREGYTISLVNIRPLKDKDLSELKRAINKLKKTASAMNGEIAGFGEDWLVVAPSFAQIYRAPKPKQVEQPQQQEEAKLEEY